ncbi:MAG: hypothetical protein WCV67_02905 [Victivallaceae bacterium]
MTVDATQRKAFGRYFKKVLVESGITNVEIATDLSVNPQRITNIIRGDGIFTPEQFNAIIDKFKRIVDDEYLDRLTDLFVQARSGLDMNSMDNAQRVVDPLDRLILDKCANLKESQKYKLIKLLERLEIGNLDEMGALAEQFFKGEIAEERAPYNAKPPTPPAKPAGGTKKTGPAQMDKQKNKP